MKRGGKGEARGGKGEEKEREGKEKRRREKKIKAILTGEQVLLEQSEAARELYNTSRYGEPDKTGAIQLSILEALYLTEKGKITVHNARGTPYTLTGLLRRAKQLQKNFWTRYVVYREMRERGYIVKTALKFGADFRVYDRGVKPGQDHARWVLFAIQEGEALTWHDFAAKNRVAHSTKKKLLIGIVDDEGDVTFYEVSWKRP